MREKKKKESDFLQLYSRKHGSASYRMEERGVKEKWIDEATFTRHAFSHTSGRQVGVWPNCLQCALEKPIGAQ